MIEIKHPPQYTHELLQSVNRLAPFFAFSETATTTFSDEVQLRRAIANPLYSIVVAWDAQQQYGGEVVGMASIYFQHNAYKTIAEIHDVVVDPASRGEGIGEKLVRALLEKADTYATAIERPITILLTSRPERKAANKLYRKLGFKLLARASGKNGTNLYGRISTPRSA